MKNRSWAAGNMCACFSRGQAGGWGLLSLQMKHTDRVTRIMKAKNFRVSMLSGEYYLYYLPAATTLICSRAGKCAIDLPSQRAVSSNRAEYLSKVIVNQSWRYLESSMYIVCKWKEKIITPATKWTFSDLLRVPWHIISYWGPLSKPDNKTKDPPSAHKFTAIAIAS